MGGLSGLQTWSHVPLYKVALPSMLRLKSTLLAGKCLAIRFLIITKKCICVELRHMSLCGADAHPSSL